MTRQTLTLIALVGLVACGVSGIICPVAWGEPETAPGAAALVERDDTSAPEAWGGKPLKRQPAATGAASEKPAEGLLPLPALHSTSRLPLARLRLGQGRVDLKQARTLLGANPVYTVKAKAPGIVEYLYPAEGVVKAGESVVRLYDLAILPDLRVAESAMSRFLSGPYVISAHQPGLPPVPPASDFPQPLTWRRLLGLEPDHQEAHVSRGHSPQGAATDTRHRPTLAPATGLAPAPAAESNQQVTNHQPQPPTPRPSAAVAGLSNELAKASGRVEELGAALGAAEAEVDSLTARLQQAQQDLTAREQLYRQGVLARNVLETAQDRVADLQRQLARAREELARARDQRELALKRKASLQDDLDGATVAARAERSAPQPAADAQHRDTPAPRATVSRTSAQPAPVAVTSRPEALEVETVQPAGFPSPTVPPRRYLANLPRQRTDAELPRATVGLPAVPEEARHLSAPRWEETVAPTSGTVVRQLVPPGAQVEAGTPLLEVLSRDFGRLYADVPLEDIESFPEGALVEVTFEDYPGVVLQGWINARKPLKEAALVRVELVAICETGYYPGETAETLQWLALSAPLVENEIPEPLAATAPEGAIKKPQVYQVLPLVPADLVPVTAPAPARVPGAQRDFVGLLRLGESEQTAQAALEPNSAQAKRLASLRQWREQFTSGMTTSVFGELPLTYPRTGEIKAAVERMATSRVSHDPNRCARTLREALGWGLGDAAQWMHRLPQRGYLARPDGLARPGDILVWPFTYGSRRTQHIGIAVSQGGRLMLLSNLAGTLGTTELVPGYMAYYQPDPPATPTAAAPVKSASR
jgi:hypothetical protein